MIDYPEALYNLGLLTSEESELEEDRLLLCRAVVANACDAHAQANAQVALRQGLEAALELEPQIVFAMRSLGGLLVIAGSLTAGAERYRQALAVAPVDLITALKLAQRLRPLWALRP